MKQIPAGEVNISSTSPIWDLLTEDLVEVYHHGDKDMIVLDTEWFLIKISEAEPEFDIAGNQQRIKLESALDSDPECEGWRALKLLYILPR